MWLTIFFCVTLLYIIYRLIKFWIINPWSIQRDFSRQGVPGRYIPIVGEILHRHQAILDDKPYSYVEQAAIKFGDYYHSSFGPFPCLHTSDPGLIESVLKTNSRFYHRAKLGRAILSAFLGYENVLLAEDENHTRHRRLVTPVFQHQNLNSMISSMANITLSFLEKWRITNNEKSSPLTLDILKEMSNLTLDIVTGCVFGVEAMQDRHIHEFIYENLKVATNEMEKRIYNMTIIIPIIKDLPLPGKRRIDKCRRDIKNITLKIINQRRQGLTKATCKGPDLLDLLLGPHGDDTRHKFTDEEVSDEALTFVLAGHETTATLMTWALHDLVTNPDVYEQCQNEINTIFNEHKGFETTMLSHLKYTEAVLKETLRYHPPVTLVARTATADNTIVASDGKQIHIKKGIDVILDLNIISR
ncbi:unnamed protein product [Rotaria sp. Silwood1]|nr:unnamed protein product [Rotaria sp. Silwood1]CAF1632834.1 unnamed protein product [Rotaria sp. Silwood1]